MVRESPYELHQIQHGYSEHRGHEHPSPLSPVKVRTLPEEDWQQSDARERKTKQDHGRDRHLAQCDLPEIEARSPKASSGHKGNYGDDMNVPIEHCFRL